MLVGEQQVAGSIPVPSTHASLRHRGRTGEKLLCRIVSVIKWGRGPSQDPLIWWKNPKWELHKITTPREGGSVRCLTASGTYFRILWLTLESNSGMWETFSAFLRKWDSIFHVVIIIKPFWSESMIWFGFSSAAACQRDTEFFLPNNIRMSHDVSPSWFPRIMADSLLLLVAFGGEKRKEIPTMAPDNEQWIRAISIWIFPH